MDIYKSGIVKKGENVPDTVRDTRIGELRRYSKRILIQTDEYINNCKKIQTHFSKIKKYLDTQEEYSNISKKIEKLLNQYETSTGKVSDRYENLAISISEYVDDTLNNLRTALDKVIKLNSKIESCESELDRYGKK